MIKFNKPNLDKISEFRPGNHDDQRSDAVMGCSEHVLDHDEEERIVVDVRVQLTDNHGDGVEDQVADEHQDGADQVWFVTVIKFLLLHG